MGKRPGKAKNGKEPKGNAQKGEGKGNIVSLHGGSTSSSSLGDQAEQTSLQERLLEKFNQKVMEEDAANVEEQARRLEHYAKKKMESDAADLEKQKELLERFAQKKGQAVDLQESKAAGDDKINEDEQENLNNDWDRRYCGPVTHRGMWGWVCDKCGKPVDDPYMIVIFTTVI